MLIANSMLVPHWATWEEFRRLEAAGLTMFGQMTAGSWIYIGTQGILQGTYETFAAMAAQRFGGIAGRDDHADRRPGRHGRRAAARGHDERRRGALHRLRPVWISRRIEHGYLDAGRRRLDDAIRHAGPGGGGQPLSIGLIGNAADLVPQLWPMGAPPTSSPTRPRPTIR